MKNLQINDHGTLSLNHSTKPSGYSRTLFISFSRTYSFRRLTHSRDTKYTTELPENKIRATKKKIITGRYSKARLYILSSSERGLSLQSSTRAMSHSIKDTRNPHIRTRARARSIILPARSFPHRRGKYRSIDGGLKVIRDGANSLVNTAPRRLQRSR